ncbi:MAG: hypothetical protein KGY39_01650 [Anaerolineales bacterium]|nr:hypothetical protein [Anaerolineales bacterium]
MKSLNWRENLKEIERKTGGGVENAAALYCLQKYKPAGDLNPYPPALIQDVQSAIGYNIQIREHIRKTPQARRIV